MGFPPLKHYPFTLNGQLGSILNPNLTDTTSQIHSPMQKSITAYRRLFGAELQAKIAKGICFGVMQSPHQTIVVRTKSFMDCWFKRALLSWRSRCKGISIVLRAMRLAKLRSYPSTLWWDCHSHNH